MAVSHGRFHPPTHALLITKYSLGLISVKGHASRTEKSQVDSVCWREVASSKCRSLEVADDAHSDPISLPTSIAMYVTAPFLVQILAADNLMVCALLHVPVSALSCDRTPFQVRPPSLRLSRRSGEGS